jgi:hypothetical protein
MGSSPQIPPDYLLSLVEEVGIVQHAYGTIPNRQAATASTTRRGW